MRRSSLRRSRGRKKRGRLGRSAICAAPRRCRLPTSWNNAASPYLPLQAGERVLQLQGGTLSPWEGFAVLCGYAAAALAVAAVLLRRRDV